MLQAVVTLVLFALFLPLSIYFIANSMLRFFGGVPFITFFGKPFGYLLVFSVVVILTLFGIGKLMKSKVTFTGVVAKFGSFTVIPMLLSLACFLFSVVRAYEPALFLLLLSVLTWLVAATYTIYSFASEEKRGLDPLHGAILFFIVISLLFMAISDELGRSLTGLLYF